VGWAGLELLDRVVPDGAPEEGLLDVAWGYLEALQDRRGRAAAVLLFYAFELQLLERLGLAPELSACRVCGRGPSASVHLDLGSASWTCDRCRVAGGAPWRLPGAAIATLRVLQRQPWEELATDTPTRRAVGMLLHRLLTAHLERYRYPRSLRLLKRLDAENLAPPGSAPELPEMP
jgi:DNA repair protein RecO